MPQLKQETPSKALPRFVGLVHWLRNFWEARRKRMICGYDPLKFSDERVVVEE